jgi:hypothetical protein
MLSLKTTPTAEKNTKTWLTFLVIISIAFSYFFACAVPLAALAAAAAITMPRREAIIFILCAWYANQLVGFALLDYPQTANSFIWGGVMALAGIGSTLAAFMATGRLSSRKLSEPLRYVASFAAAFLAYEAILFIAALTPLGGLQDFAPEIIGRVLAIDMLALGIIYGMHKLAVARGFLSAAKLA